LTYDSWLPVGQYIDITGVLSGITAAIVAATIFLYKKRSQQLNFAKAAQWACLAWLAFLVYLVYRDNVIQTFFESNSPLDMALLAIPILAYILVGLGKKAIRSDIELLKSADRIR